MELVEKAIKISKNFVDAETICPKIVCVIITINFSYARIFAYINLKKIRKLVSKGHCATVAQDNSHLSMRKCLNLGTLEYLVFGDLSFV